MVPMQAGSSNGADARTAEFTRGTTARSPTRPGADRRVAVHDCVSAELHIDGSAFVYTLRRVGNGRGVPGTGLPRPARRAQIAGAPTVNCCSLGRRRSNRRTAFGRGRCTAGGREPDTSQLVLLRLVAGSPRLHEESSTRAHPGCTDRPVHGRRSGNAPTSAGPSPADAVASATRASAPCGTTSDRTRGEPSSRSDVRSSDRGAMLQLRRPRGSLPYR